jgi:hypothetical protein
MPLAEKSRLYKGRIVWIKPIYGWGWSRLDLTGPTSAVDYSTVERAGLLSCRIEEFFETKSQLQGFIGRLEESATVFSASWIVATVMAEGLYDFTENLGSRYDLELGNNSPTGDPPHIRSNEPVYGGFGIVGDSPERFDPVSEKS